MRMIIIMKIIQIITQCDWFEWRKRFYPIKESEKNDKEYSLSESLRNGVPKNRFLREHSPFNCFGKEKCKNVDFKKVNVRIYISNISVQLKKMSDKENYVKWSEEFKKIILPRLVQMIQRNKESFQKKEEERREQW